LQAGVCNHEKSKIIAGYAIKRSHGAANTSRHWGRRCYQDGGSVAIDESGDFLRMPHRLRRLVPESSFLRKWLLLASGTLMGQALVVISSPLLTRLFTPEEFGVFAVFAAIVGIAATLSGLRYEFAVPLASNDEDAAALVAVVVLTSGFLAAILAVFVWLIGDWLAGRLNVAELAHWFWLLPPALLIWGVGTALSYWSVRRHTYGVNALNRTVQLGTQTTGQLVMGVVGWGAPGLIVGYLCGYATRLGHFLVRLPRSDRQLLAAWQWSRLKAVAREHWRYPAFTLPSSLLARFLQLGPAIIIAAMFGPAMAGFYAVAQRVVGLPIRMLGEAASQVFLGELRGLERPALRHLFLRTLALFGGLALVAMLPLLFFAPPLFRLLLGDGWDEAGIFVQLLTPLYIARFIDVPISQLLNALNRHQLHFFLTLLNTAALIITFSAAFFLSFSIFETIVLLSALQTMGNLYRLLRCWQAVS
jgi:O-antigen/teichoic acid export membrane protein